MLRGVHRGYVASRRRCVTSSVSFKSASLLGNEHAGWKSMKVEIEKFAEIVKAALPADIEKDFTLGGKLTLSSSGPISIHYAPFDYIQKSARIVIVGITPGAHQARAALLEMQRELQCGRGIEAALAAAKVCASFAGPMRVNLVQMLDFIGVNRWLEVESVAQLWSKESHLVHFTSALRYPVFLNKKNYSGQPRIRATDSLLSMVGTFLAAEANELQHALWVPLGPVSTDALQWLADQKVLDRSRILQGLPHPSGANAERIAYFLGRKERHLLSSKTNPGSIDAARDQLLRQVSAL